MRHVIVLAGCFFMIAGHASAATQEQIGSWVLNCPQTTPSTDPCLLRFKKRFFDKGGITGDLEVLAVGKSLVPVITLRGLADDLMMAASLAGRTDASIRFSNGPSQALDCAPNSGAYICAPRNEAARVLASGLPAARSVTVRLSATVSGLKSLPVQEKTVDLSGTSEALARLRTMGPSPLPGPITALASQSPGALIGMADKAMKAAGYPNGVADMRALLAKYRGR